MRLKITIFLFSLLALGAQNAFAAGNAPPITILQPTTSFDQVVHGNTGTNLGNGLFQLNTDQGSTLCQAPQPGQLTSATGVCLQYTPSLQQNGGAAAIFGLQGPLSDYTSPNLVVAQAGNVGDRQIVVKSDPSISNLNMYTNPTSIASTFTSSVTGAIPSGTYFVPPSNTTGTQEAFNPTAVTTVIPLSAALTAAIPVGQTVRFTTPTKSQQFTALAASVELTAHQADTGTGQAWAGNFISQAEPGSTGSIHGIEIDTSNFSSHIGGFGVWLGNNGTKDMAAGLFANSGVNGASYTDGVLIAQATAADFQSQSSANASYADAGSHQYGSIMSGVYRNTAYELDDNTTANLTASQRRRFEVTPKGGVVDGSKDPFAAAEGFSYAAPAGSTGAVAICSAASLNAGTISLPLTTLRGHPFTVISECPIKALTLAVPNGTTVFGGPSVLGIDPSTPITLFYDADRLRWVYSTVSFVNPTGGTVSRTFADIFSEVIKVANSGAKCDGVTDDTAAFQDAFSKAAGSLQKSNGGAVIELPVGRCVISAAISTTLGPNAAITVRGQGMYQSEIIQTGGTDGLVFNYPITGGQDLRTPSNPGAGVYLHDFALIQGDTQNRTIGRAIALIGPNPTQHNVPYLSNMIDKVDIRTRAGTGVAGSTNVTTQEWANDIYDQDVGNVTIMNGQIIHYDYANGTEKDIRIVSNSPANTFTGNAAGQIVISNENILAGLYGVSIEGNNIQGVYVFNSPMTAVGHDVNWNCSTCGNGFNGPLTVQGSSMAATYDSVVANSVTQIHIKDNEIIAAGSPTGTDWCGVCADNVSSTDVSGNVLLQMPIAATLGGTHRSTAVRVRNAVGAQYESTVSHNAIGPTDFGLVLSGGVTFSGNTTALNATIPEVCYTDLTSSGVHPTGSNVCGDQSYEYAPNGPKTFSGSMQVNGSQGTAALTVSGGIKTDAVSYTTVGQRPPAQTDDSAHGFVVGSLYVYNGREWRLDDATTGFAGWTDITSSVLPGDVVGQRVSAASIASGGTGFSSSDVGKTVTLAGGTVLAITTVSSGAVTGVSISDPHWFACTPTVSQAVVSGTAGGTGLTFNLNTLIPWFQGTRLLTKCYSGPEKQITRSDINSTFNVPFLSSGSADDAAEDAFSDNHTPFVTKWYDQGGTTGGIGDATNLSNYAPVSNSARRLGNARPIMFDAQGEGQNASLNYGSGVTFNSSAGTLVSLGSALTVGAQAVAFMQMGPANYSAPFAALGQNNYAPYATFSTGANTTSSIREDGSLFMGSSSGSTATAYLDGAFYTGSSQSQNLSGGALGYGANGVSGQVEEDLAMVIPFALSQPEMAALAASIYQTFAIQPQGQDVVVFLGHSLVSASGAIYQQTWTRKVQEMMGRSDVHFVNYGKGGDTLAHQLTLWPTVIQPTLAHYAGTKTAFMMGGDNDLAGGSTVAQVIASYTSFVGLAHASGARAICGLNAYANRGGGSYSTVLAFQQAMGQVFDGVAAQSGCDAIYDERLQPVFGNVNGPFSGPLYAPDQVHKSNLGQAVEANMFLPILAGTHP